MSEGTFRAVVASVLVGALALAAVVFVALLPRSTVPLPSASIATGPEATPVPSVAPTPIPGPVFAAPGVVSVGLIPRGATSPTTLVLQFVESRADAIPDAPGSFQVTLVDQAGSGSTVAFAGTPSVGAPGSLGVTASFSAPNILMVTIAASDSVNVEPITITGLGIRASSTAAIGPVVADLGFFTGSLAGGIAGGKGLPSPGSVTNGP